MVRGKGARRNPVKQFDWPISVGDMGTHREGQRRVPPVESHLQHSATRRLTKVLEFAHRKRRRLLDEHCGAPLESAGCVHCM
jgi:hypothetical protein